LEILPAIAHFSMGCNMDPKGSKKKANKMGRTKKKAKKEPFFILGSTPQNRTVILLLAASRLPRVGWPGTCLQIDRSFRF